MVELLTQLNRTKEKGEKKKSESDTYQIFASGKGCSGIWINSHKLHTHIRDIHTYTHTHTHTHTQIHYPCMNLNENETRTKDVNIQNPPQK